MKKLLILLICVLGGCAYKPVMFSYCHEQTVSFTQQNTPCVGWRAAEHLFPHYPNYVFSYTHEPPVQVLILVSPDHEVLYAPLYN